jgi:hypothetical protein
MDADKREPFSIIAFRFGRADVIAHLSKISVYLRVSAANPCFFD